VSGAGVGPEEQQPSTEPASITRLPRRAEFAMRGTEAQDQLTDAGPALARRRRRLAVGAAAAVGLLLLSAFGA
jgi:hypothetical protein